MSKTLQIAIDGPAAAGKTTMAKKLSKSLNITYLDTGRLYRAMAYFYKTHNITAKEEMARNTNMEIKFLADNIFLNGEDIKDKIYTPEISEGASVCSTVPEVRKKLLKLQTQLIENQSCIMDGRDIGTVIMPNAQVKFYLTASDLVRAQRRILEQHSNNDNPSTYNMLDSNNMHQVLKEIHERDKRDMTREIAPLKQAEDALYIDNTYMTIDNTFDIMYRICKLTAESIMR